METVRPKDILEVRDGERRVDYGIRVANSLVSEARKQGGLETWIYFIQEGCVGGAIKVGVARNPPSRLAMLQTGNPTRLVLRGLFWAPVVLERIIHRAFVDDRLVGEWFAASEALEAVADGLHYFTTTDAAASGRLFEEPWGGAVLLARHEAAA